MPRQLEIHHLDIGQGDSSLILVKDMANPAVPVVQRAVLIDGGLYNQGATVLNYINALGLAAVDLVIASHYDKDHYWGLRPVLGDANARYNNTVICDRGELGTVNQFGRVTLGRDDAYIDYLQRAGVRNAGYPASDFRNTDPGKPNRRRPTTWMESTGSNAPIPNGWAGQPDVPPGGQWLTGGWLPTLPDVLNVPGGGAPPMMLCIASNQYVRLAAGGSSFVVGGMAIDDNPQSVGWLLTFNNFRYYTAGDLTVPQEDRAAAFTGGLTAFKLSHHGSDTSTSQNFLNLTNPRVGVISCANNNSYGLPTQTIINRLNVHPSIENYFVTSCGANFALLPGCNGINQWATGAKPRVAGSNTQPGHVVITVTEAQSTHNPCQFTVSYYEWNLNMQVSINY